MRDGEKDGERETGGGAREVGRVHSNAHVHVCIHVTIHVYICIHV